MATAFLELFSSLPVVFEKSAASNPADNPSRDWELGNIIALALLMVSWVDRLRESWFPKDKTDCPSFNWARAQQVADLYKQWLSVAEPIIVKMRSPGNSIAELKGSDELKARYRDVKLMSLDMDHLKQSIEFFDQGAGIPFDVAMEELRNNLQ